MITVPGVELRSFIFINRLQPQTMCYLGSWIRGSLPRSGDAAQVIEIAPGLDIEPLTDVALKHASVQAGILVVERHFGYLEMHGGNDEVRAASTAVLEALGATASDATKPEVLASKIITMLDPQHAFLINRNKIGSMALAGESLFVLEMQPASYAILAANEAEKAARIKVVDYRMIGATGRVYLSGSEADVRQAAEAAEEALHAAGEPVVTDDLASSGPWSARCSATLLAAPAPAAPASAVSLDPDSGHNSPHNPGRRRRRRRRAPAQEGAGFTTRDAVRDVETVSLRTDAELDAFVRRLLHLFENPKHRADLRAGRLRFRLAPQRAAGAARPAHRIEKGAVTEAAVRAAAQAGARLVLGRRAVLTPLARDRARAAGVEIEKEH